MMRALRWWLPLIVFGCSDTPYCDSCEIDLEEAVTLEDAGYTMSSRVVRTSDGGFAAIGTYDPERIVRFDRLGGVVRTTGRKGSGPGEFNRLSRLTVGNGDTLFLVDGARIHILDPDLNWTNTVAAPMVPTDLVILPDGAIVGHPASSRSRGLPTLYKLHRDSAQQVFWFDYHTDDVPLSGFRLISAHDGEIWSVGRVTLDVKVFDYAGTPVRTFRIEHPWFDSREPDGSVRVEDIVHVSDGRLLVLIAREREDWEPPPVRTTASEEAGPVQLSGAQVIDRREQQILLTDRNGELMLTSGSPSGVALLGFADGEHLYGHRGEEELLIRVWRARLNVPPYSWP